MKKGGAVRSSIRRKVLASVGALILLSLVGSTISLYRITEVNRSLDAINRVSVPLGRLLAQMKSDSEILRREMDRRLGYLHWRDGHWQPQPIPRWISDMIESELERAKLLVKNSKAWAPADVQEKWRKWVDDISTGFEQVKAQAASLHAALERKDEKSAGEIYPKWTQVQDNWMNQLKWGGDESERFVRQAFTRAETRVTELRTGLQALLIVVVFLSALLLWLGERALRPLAELTRLARNITERGLRKEDKSRLPEIPLSRTDEVSQLAREFHSMATALLEREKTVEIQKHRLEENNRLLREMGDFNKNVLNSIKSILIVTDLKGRITRCNPVAVNWLGRDINAINGAEIFSFPQLLRFVDVFPGGRGWPDHMERMNGPFRIEPREVNGRIYGGHLMLLRQPEGDASGVIVVFDDITDQLELEKRLRLAENMIAVGRMSAQVAHEIRNPLHSIGLEAEMALEAVADMGQANLKESLQSILAAVDRLEKITENYLRLSRLSAGKKSRVDLGDVLESVLATYASACQARGITVDWRREKGADFVIWGDRDLLEQVFGNLFRNAMQALEGERAATPTILWSLGNAESGRIWVRVVDNGPGIAPEIRNRLFTPFVTTKAQGTGLGLSFVKKVVEDHSGEICSRTVERGACFEMVFPMISDEHAVEDTRKNVEVLKNV